MDERVCSLLANAVAKNERAFVVLVGDKGREQIVNLYAVRSKLRSGRANVCWVYKKDLGFTTHKMKRLKQIKKRQARGTWDMDSEEPFWLFQQNTDIHYCRYRDSHRLLGATFDLCVLQDFEAVTPNLLCRTVETVAGGGLIILLLKSVSSLQQLYQLSLDAHKELLKDGQVKPRFCQRLILSLTECGSCLVMDDELNVLPLSKKQLAAIPSRAALAEIDAEVDPELLHLRNALDKDSKLRPLLDMCKTVDQARTLANVCEHRSGVLAITAARGRGKSAGLGMAVALALATGVEQIVVTAPSPENVATLFEFVIKGLTALGFVQGTDFLAELFQVFAVEAVEADDSTLALMEHLKARKVIVRVCLREKLSVRYVFPFEALAQVPEELQILVVDEAAAMSIPLMRVLSSRAQRTLLASTIDGYEGSGGALALQFFMELKRSHETQFAHTCLSQPIRYAAGDPIEKWLRKVLCLNSCEVYKLEESISEARTQAYLVDRDSLFCFHSATEAFLARLISLFAASSHKNSPDDLLRLSDAPNRQLAVLVAESESPILIAAAEVVFEGKEKEASVSWTVDNYFPDSNFASLNGAVVERIATHPKMRNRGFATTLFAALEAWLLKTPSETTEDSENKVEESDDITTELAAPSVFPPLLRRIEDEDVTREADYIGVHCDFEKISLNFWQKNGLSPVYMSLASSEITGAHSVIMLKQLRKVNGGHWLRPFALNFADRFLCWLGSSFRSMPNPLAARILYAVFDEKPMRQVKVRRIFH